MISLSFLLLSRGSFTTPLSPILSLIISPSCVPLTPVLLNGARPSFYWRSHGPRRQLLHPPPLLLPQVVWHLWWSLRNLSIWMLTLVLSLLSCIRWTLMWLVLHIVRLALVASMLLPLHLHKLRRTRTMMMALVMMMMMRIRMLALLVMRRWLLLSDLPFVIRDKKGK